MVSTIPLPLVAGVGGTRSQVYNGLAATRAQANTLLTAGGLDTTNKQMMVRSTHTARNAISSLQIMAANFFVSQGAAAEVGPGASATITAAIEYPAGTFVQVLFSGSSSGTIPDGGTLLSDSVTISIPSGAQFWVRQYITCTAGIIWNFAYSQITGDKIARAVSGLADETMGGPISGGATGMHFPLAIIAPITSPSIAILGDSIAWGSSDTQTSDGYLGFIARTIGPLFGYSNIATPSDRAQKFLLSNTQRAKVIPYCSHFIVEYSTNDFNAGRSLAEVQADLSSIYAMFGARTGFQTTCLPRTSTTDGGTTTVNQTLPSWESTRVAFNHALTGGTFGPNGGTFDTSSIVETSTDSGIWKVSPSQWTTDCIHPIAYACGQVASSGIIDTSRIHRP